METSLMKSVRNVFVGPFFSHSTQQFCHILTKASKNPTAILVPPCKSWTKKILFSGRGGTFIRWWKCFLCGHVVLTTNTSIKAKNFLLWDILVIRLNVYFFEKPKENITIVSWHYGATIQRRCFGWDLTQHCVIPWRLKLGIPCYKCEGEKQKSKRKKKNDTQKNETTLCNVLSNISPHTDEKRQWLGIENINRRN